MSPVHMNPELEENTLSSLAFYSTVLRTSYRKSVATTTRASDVVSKDTFPLLLWGEKHACILYY